jgi:hypothetical protein
MLLVLLSVKLCSIARYLTERAKKGVRVGGKGMSGDYGDDWGSPQPLRGWNPPRD